jgi:hypothetical protein
VAAIHDDYRREYRRWANLLRPRCPGLKGSSAVAEFYFDPSNTSTSSSPRVEWGCKVLKSGAVVFVRVEKKEAA